MRERILITGGTGFVGRQAIAPLLKRGYEVHVVARNSTAPAVNSEHLYYHALNLFDNSKRHHLIHEIKPHRILHCAWDVTPGTYWSNLNNLSWLRLSLDLFQECSEAGAKRFVGLGTCAEYDWRFSTLRAGETPLMPSSLYGTVKSSLFNVLDKAAGQTQCTFAWARLFFMYGPHEDSRRLVAGVIRSLLSGEAPKCSEGRQQRDFLHIEDVGRALATVVDSSFAGPINIASGVAVSVRELVGTLCGLIGSSSTPRFGAIPTHQSDPPCLVADVSDLKDLGFAPEYTLVDGLASAIEWWKDSETTRL